VSHVVPIRPAALPAWRALQDVLDEVGGAVPCRGRNADWWTSNNAEHREAAAYRCAGCPITMHCARYAEAAREKFGTWAGVDRTPQPGRPKESK